jgi:hypothetical protein
MSMLVEKKCKTFKWCYLTAGYFFALELPRHDTPAKISIILKM